MTAIHQLLYVAALLLSLTTLLVVANYNRPTRMLKVNSQAKSLGHSSNSRYGGTFRYSRKFSHHNLVMHHGAEAPTRKLKPAPKIIIAGAPAAGKGTQCEKIREDFGVIHLSTGDILRAAVKSGTDLGVKAKQYMDAGQLVPDELIIGVICDRLNEADCQSHGWLLDGFPRTKVQADALTAAGMIPDCFVLLDVNEDILVERVTGRRTDPVTGNVYHLTFNPPASEEVAQRLVQRSDDNEQTIRIRYREFQSHINSIRSCYEDKMIWVDGAATKDSVTKCVSLALTDALSEGV